MDLLTNPWVVGISGGIFSGLIVLYISRLIFSKGDSKEYAQKVSSANQEVLYAIRPGISEGVIPTNSVLRSFIEATARKYSVDVADMYDLNSVASELVKEVMDSSFISASSKLEFCEKLTTIKETEDIREKLDYEKEYRVLYRYRQQLVLTLSAMVGVLTMLTSVMITLENTAIFDLENLAFMAVPAIVAILMSAVAVLAKRLRKIRSESFYRNIAESRHGYEETKNR